MNDQGEDHVAAAAPLSIEVTGRLVPICGIIVVDMVPRGGFVKIHSNQDHQLANVVKAVKGIPENKIQTITWRPNIGCLFHCNGMSITIIDFADRGAGHFFGLLCVIE